MLPFCTLLSCQAGGGAWPLFAQSAASIKPGPVSLILNSIQHAFPLQDPDFVMVITRTHIYSAAPSLKPQSKNIRFVNTQLQPMTCDPLGKNA
ncbi:hypothetical protein M011DRAFT_469965 [Sporormia fimetaria CBS 119925]|uniref:Uncharacterized protein n=1 Tax=Sporormia fimetaria CBS 119925 TaxID=1340428 RepID=A0A6A6V302_9PLEO|nr:hypothetical protein M011DRAFT_469965 [Sporormia fimetaria CBS 119925]